MKKRNNITDMPFKILKSYIIQQLLSLEEEQEEYDFQNSFSEILKRETTHEEAVILLITLVSSCIAAFF
ncbi:hypothetical protein J3D55_002180 [Chryseobacterium ginsenosidimutans]|uniref:hypothetical protein n=1 Tax=Chryseobacterium ginsenosidimutans TaxID=687846 RepID=UPI00216909DB|nr:hypothetical protein [Chryseobacterium ginsenosidimutans]MCS3869264.1 hypothetical protein [Chryseobacterium ginsenosidimutans]